LTSLDWLTKFRLSPADFSFAGSNLRRPECVVALSDGTILASDKSAAVTVLPAAGAQYQVGGGLQLANTFALDEDGGLLVTDLSRGAVMRIDGSGRPSLLHDRFNGEPLGAANFIFAGEQPGVFFLSVSSRNVDFRGAIEKPVPDGRIFRIDDYGLALVADELFFPNAMQIDHKRGYLYVVETTAGRVARARIDANGMLGAFKPFGPDPLFPGAYPDGLAVDSEGNVWLTDLARNALLVIDPAGSMHTLFEDPDGATINKPTGLAFGGPDLCTVYVGSLKMTSLPKFRSPVAGLAARSWRRGAALRVPPAVG
jgi:gluconolactonase